MLQCGEGRPCSGRQKCSPQLLVVGTVHANNSSHLSSTFTGREPEAIYELYSSNISTSGLNETDV